MLLTSPVIKLNKLYFIRVYPYFFCLSMIYYSFTELAELVFQWVLTMNFFKSDLLCDIATAVAIGLVLCIGLLAYFDVLVK